MYSNQSKATGVSRVFDLFSIFLLIISIVSALQLRVKSDLVSVVEKFFLPEKSYLRVSKKMKDVNSDDQSTTAELEEIRIANMLEDIKSKIAGVDANLIEVAMFSNNIDKNLSEIKHTSEMQAIEDDIEKFLAWDEDEKPDYVQELEDALNEIQFSGKKGLI